MSRTNCTEDDCGKCTCLDMHYATATTGRVVVSGRGNGVIWRYVDGEWTAVGDVRREYMGPRWRAFASFETEERAGKRDVAVRLLLRRLGIDADEYQQ
jgi:hypothetical protein